MSTATINKINQPGYIPQLDSLRAVAVFLVIISHWLADSHILNRYMPNGILGVTLFFVLSGYLITGILLKSKEMLAKGLSLSKAFSIFYIRRSLRIFPVYYLLIILLLLIHPQTIKPSLYWHVLYASNFYFYMHNGFATQLSHLWSLAVEEQFYLIWPAVILLTGKLKLPFVFIVCVCIAILFRFSMYSPPHHMGRLLMPGSLDSFGIGAMLAYGQFYNTKWFVKLLIIKNTLFVTMTILFILVQVGLQFYKNDWMVLTFYYFFISLYFFSIILTVSSNNGKNKLFRLLLLNPVLIYIGKISYGLYLFHLLIPNFNHLHLPAILLPYRISILFLTRFSLLVLMASASWHFIEKPLLRLKNNFDIGSISNYKKASLK